MKKITFLIRKGTTTLFLMLMVTPFSFGQLTSYNANSIPIGGNTSVAFGVNALNANVGTFNTAIGINSLRNNQGGNTNTGCGYNTLLANTGGIRNTAVGGSALSSNLTGNYNTAAGYLALQSNSTGTDNTGVGSYALRLNSQGSNNTAVGRDALYSNTSSGNTGIGYQVLFSNTTGLENSAIGLQAMFTNSNGNRNSANGYQALYFNSTGSNNTASGFAALYNNTSSFNTATGSRALYNNVGGSSNTAMGYEALLSNLDGAWNVANGSAALRNNQSGFSNTAVGASALLTNTGGYGNTATGGSSLVQNLAGWNNTANGYGALSVNTSGNDNTAIGSNANVLQPYQFNSTALGSSAIVDASNKVRIGNTNVTSIGGQVAWSNFSDGRIKRNIQANVPGLEFIKLLQPVTYNFDIAKQNELLGVKKEDANGSSEIEAIRFTGFIAQDVDAAAEKVNYDFSGVDKSGVIMGLRYSEFVVPLVKAVQELSDANDQKDAAIAQLQQQVNALQQQMDKLLGTQSGTAKGAGNQIEGASLAQNVPNPFSTMTTIGYNLPAHYQRAFLVVADLSGKTVRRIALSGEGPGELLLETGSLQDGMYTYSLVIDDHLVATHKMILMQ
jgi:trimeric autotransporter adhesin